MAAQAGGLALLVGCVGATVAALSRRREVRVAYTRKMFHFIVFTAAAFVHTMWTLPGTIVFGAVIAGMVVAAIVQGDGSPFYEALARDTDRPHRTLFIIIPMLTTAVGGLAAALITGPYAVVGYLATGWGDAVGEPVGARFGRHPYNVPSLAGVPATRTLEGSAAVFVVATMGSMLALSTMNLDSSIVWVGLLCGAVAAVVEGVSNHGLDNLTVQIAPSVVAWLMLG